MTSSMKIMVLIEMAQNTSEDAELVIGAEREDGISGRLIDTPHGDAFLDVTFVNDRELVLRFEPDGGHTLLAPYTYNEAEEYWQMERMNLTIIPRKEA